MTLGIFSTQTTPLPHVTWPVEPIPGESVAGHLVRSASHNAISRPSVLTVDAGLPPHQRIGSIAASSHSLSGLATMLAVDPEWLDRNRHPVLTTTRGGSAKTVIFHGATIRRAHLEENTRLFSPAALRESAHHREAWHIASLPLDLPTWTVLSEVCPHEGCGRSPGWSRTKGLAVCEHCLKPLTDADVHEVLEEEKQWVAIAAGVLSQDAAERQAALAQLPASLQGWDRGDIHELAWLLGVAGDRDFETASVEPGTIPPLRRLSAMARGYRLLSGWPASFKTMVESAIETDAVGTTIATLVSHLRRVMKRSSTFGRAAHALSNALGAFHTNSFATTIANSIGHYTTRGFGAATGLSRSDVRSLRRAGLIQVVVLRDLSRTMALYPPGEVEAVRASAGGRRSVRECARRLGIGADAVRSLVASGHLRRADDAITLHLHDDMHIDAASLDSLAMMLEGRLLTPASCITVTLRVALRRLPGTDKPWVALITAILEGRLTLHRNATASLSLRDCRIARRHLRRLEGLPSSSSAAIVGSPWISDHDSWERLNCGMRNLRHLVRNDLLESSGRVDGQTFLRTDVDRLANELICMPEIKARVADGRSVMWIDERLAGHGLAPDAGGFLPRAEAELAVGLR